MVGRRPRTTYSITPAGREALSRWLGTDGAPPALEFEGMLRVLFADQGTIGQLRRSITAIAGQARARRAHFASVCGGGSPVIRRARRPGLRVTPGQRSANSSFTDPGIRMRARARIHESGR